MAIPTKGQATLAAAQYGAQFAQRVDDMLNGNMNSGFIGGTIGYGGAGPGVVTAVVTTLNNRGWTVVQDDVGKTLTIT